MQHSEAGVISGRVDRTTQLPLSLQLDRAAPVTLPVQLAARLREAIDAATLRPGEAIPASRQLASTLGVARGVVVAAYQQLIGEGYLLAQHGRATIVHPALRLAGLPGAAASAAAPQAAPAPQVEPVRGPLTPGEALTTAMHTAAWRAAWRGAAARSLVAAPPLGDPELRAQIAEQLRLMRATVRPANDIIVTAGTRDGLSLLLTALGGTRAAPLIVGVEDPGLPSLQAVARCHGARLVPLPTDSSGLNPQALPQHSLDVVIVTPSHQYPLGGSLPLVRRLELLRWASAQQVVIVEDDFDSELRHRAAPLPALAALDDPHSGAVVLLGTFSKTIAPALSAGYLLAPAKLLPRLSRTRLELGGPVSAVVQSALASYLASGELRRHTVRLQRSYAERRDLVSEYLAGIASVRLRPMDGGLNAVIEFIGGQPEQLRQRANRVMAASRRQNLGAQPLANYWQSADSGIPGIVIGLGVDDSAEFCRALTLLRELLKATAEKAQYR